MQKFHFNSIHKRGINHLGEVKFHNNKKLSTPLCWFGLSIIESNDFQEKVFQETRIEAFLSNAYDLYYNPHPSKRKELIENLKNLGIIHKMDSGGFQLMKSKMKGNAEKFPLSQIMVIKKQLEVDCECGVQLDFPFGPNLKKGEKFSRLDKTIENLEKALNYINKLNLSFSILPVIHTTSDDLELLFYGLEKIKEIIGEYPKVIGIGSLVPLVKTVKGSRKNGIENFIYSLISLRKMLPNSFIHAFGIGGTMAYLAILAGIDSYDSNGWIQKSAFGVIQLPGISDRFLKKESHNRPYLIKNRNQRSCKESINEIDIFMKCKCSACKPFFKEDWKENDWKRKQKAFHGRDENSRLLRAIHNVSLYQNEIYEIREAIKNDNLLDFIKNRLRFSIYFKYIEFIENLKRKEIDELNNFNELINIQKKKGKHYS